MERVRCREVNSLMAPRMPPTTTLQQMFAPNLRDLTLELQRSVAEQDPVAGLDHGKGSPGKEMETSFSSPGTSLVVRGEIGPGFSRQRTHPGSRRPGSWGQRDLEGWLLPFLAPWKCGGSLRWPSGVPPGLPWEKLKAALHPSPGPSISSGHLEQALVGPMVHTIFVRR